MARSNYIPNRGDIVWLQFTPQVGHEQAGHRPALVLSPSAYNSKVGLMLCCPITSQVKGYPYEVTFRSTAGIEGVVLADQVKSLDWRARKAKKKEKADQQVVDEVIAKLHTLLS